MRPSAFLSDADWAAVCKRLHLSPREAAIARAILHNDDEEAVIGDHLGIARRTVKEHLNRA
jgi:DNA-binding CsgD family transcriptional regulator